MSILHTNIGYGILFYINGSNKGDVGWIKLKHLEYNIIVHHGLKYWQWIIDGGEWGLEQLNIVNYVVL